MTFLKKYNNPTQGKQGRLQTMGNRGGLIERGNHGGLTEWGNHRGLPLRDRNRRSIRLWGYDYSQAGAYFVTICTQKRACLFGDIIDGNMVLNDAGRMVDIVWNEIPKYYAGIDIDAFQIMPNHIHGIIVIVVGAGPCACPDTGQPQGVAPTTAGLSLPDVVHRFKTLTTKRYADGVKQHNWPRFPGKLWQRNYYEHIVRNENELNRIRQYIINNPVKWELDRENPNGSVGADLCVCPDGPRACPGNETVRESSQQYGNEQWMI